MRLCFFRPSYNPEKSIRATRHAVANRYPPGRAVPISFLYRSYIVPI